jgi:hypothetical protein
MKRPLVATAVMLSAIAISPAAYADDLELRDLSALFGLW